MVSSTQGSSLATRIRSLHDEQRNPSRYSQWARAGAAERESVCQHSGQLFRGRGPRCRPFPLRAHAWAERLDPGAHHSSHPVERPAFLERWTLRRRRSRRGFLRRARCPQHPRIQVGRSRRRGRVFVDPQRPSREPPADTRHPGAGLDRGRCNTRGRRSGLPARKMLSRAPRIDARGGAEVLPEVEQHVDHARPHLSRRRQWSGVVPIADDLPLASEDAVDGERQSNREPVHATAGTARLIPFDDEVAVVLLDREVNHPEAIDRRPRDGASECSEYARRPK